MTSENFEFVDREYGQVSREKPSRQIKTRKASFSSIVERFNNFRIKMKAKKLEKMKESALNATYNRNSIDKEITKKTTAIARLEEKIMILSREDVPEDYVKRRAIKLRKNMMDNLVYNCNNTYQIEEESKKTIFEEEGILDDFAEDEERMESEEVDSLDKEKINVVPGELERQSIVDAVNAEFPNMEDKESKEDDSKPEEVEEQAKEEENPFAFVTQEKVDIPEKNEEVEEEATKKEETLEAETINQADIREEINDAIRKIRVSRNESQSAKVDRYDRDGNPFNERKKYNYIPMTEEEIKASQVKIGLSEEVKEEPQAEMHTYTPMTEKEIKASQEKISNNNQEDFVYTPMTEEEIRESQIKLSFDENGNIVDSGKRVVEEENVTARVVDSFTQETEVPSDELNPEKNVVRDNPIVVEEREKEEKDLGFEDGKNLFEVIKEDTPENSTKEEEVIVPVEEEKKEPPKQPKSGKIDEYTELREKILSLKNRKELTQQKKAEAEKRAEAVSQQALQAKKIADENKRRYDERLEMLRNYSQQLENDCSDNEKSAELADKDAQMNQNFIEAQEKEAQDYSRMVGEIDALISPSEETVVHTK